MRTEYLKRQLIYLKKERISYLENSLKIAKKRLKELEDGDE